MRFLVLVVLVAAATAQLEHPFNRWQPGVVQPRRIVQLPQQSNRRLVAAEQPIGKMMMFGTDVLVNTTLADGVWTDVDGGRTWSMTFLSDGAYSMNIHFTRFFIPGGAAVWFYGNDRHMQGAYTEENNYPSGEFGNWPIEGDSITIEYFSPDGVTEEPILDIGHVVHGYRKNELACFSSGTCNINSVCDPDFGNRFANQIRAGGMLLNGAGNGYCSGSLINTIGNNNRQYFLTAAHCGTSHTAILFNWRSPQCQTTSCPAMTDRVANLRVLARNTEPDFTLVEVGEQIPSSFNVFLSGFSASTVAATDMTCIHHPSGDVQKMAYAHKTAVPDRWSGSGPSTHWRVTSWDERSTTEPGSSGSPLHDQSGRIIGQLHGGSASCSNLNGYDTYGGIYFSWNVGLSGFLDPLGTGQIQVDGTNLL